MGPANDFKERSERMSYGGNSYEVVKGRMDEVVRAHEHYVLAKQLRAARMGEPPRRSMVARGTAAVLALFR